MGMLGMSFVLPLFLQDARHLTAQQNGLWQLPTGVFIILGAQVGGRLIHRFGTTTVVRFGLCSYVLGILFILRAVSVDITWWQLLPGLAFYGIGIGFAGAQLTNVVLSDIPKESSGVASGANTTVRQVGAALGVAVIGSIVVVETLRQATSRIASAALPTSVKVHAIAGVHAFGASYTPPASTSPHDATLLSDLLRQSVASATRIALVFAVVVVSFGALISFLIPRVGPSPEVGVDLLEPLEPIDLIRTPEDVATTA
jgi:MFS family permease